MTFAYLNIICERLTSIPFSKTIKTHLGERPSLLTSYQVTCVIEMAVLLKRSLVISTE